jgi:uncharacterized protein YggE
MFRALSLMAFVSLAAPAAAQPPQPPQPGPPAVVTTGEATVKRAPDRAWVLISAESRAKTPREAQKLNVDAMSAVMQKLKAAGLPADAIRTASYDLQPEFDHRDGRQTLRGYVARNSIEVRLDEVARTGEILEMVVGAGATNVSGVRFDLKDRAAAEREALRRAVADARARAEAAAAGAGMQIDKVLRIEEQREFMPPPRPMRMMQTAEMAVTASGDVPVSPGELEIRSVVTLTAAIR